tara:strand:- start:459 stop:890 length:432 start_codon:yes stop_codon:yes gene_type:complete
MSKELGALRGVYTNYGTRPVGGLSGRQKTSGVEEEAIFEVFAGDLVEANYPITLPKHYLVEELYVEVEEAFAASSTCDLSIDGGAGLTTDPDLTVLGVTSYVLTGLANTKGVGTEVDIVITPNANAIASGTGKARVLVKYKNM